MQYSVAVNFLQRLSPRAELILVNVICFGPFAAMSIAGMLRHESHLLFDDRRIWTTILIEIVCAPLAILLLRARGWKLSDFDLKPSMLLTIAGVALFIATNLVIAGAYLGVQSLFGSDPAAATSPAVATSWLPLLLLLAIDPIYEEVFEVTYNVRATEGSGAAFGITLSAFVRLVCHLWQGPVAVFTILPMGLIMAAVYWKWRRTWPIVIAHAMAVYLSLEPGTRF